VPLSHFGIAPSLLRGTHESSKETFLFANQLKRLGPNGIFNEEAHRDSNGERAKKLRLPRVLRKSRLPKSAFGPIEHSEIQVLRNYKFSDLPQ
jgi:hypothetical protein